MYNLFFFFVKKKTSKTSTSNYKWLNRIVTKQTHSLTENYANVFLLLLVSMLPTQLYFPYGTRWTNIELLFHSLLFILWIWWRLTRIEQRAKQTNNIHTQTIGTTIHVELSATNWNWKLNEKNNTPYAVCKWCVRCSNTLRIRIRIGVVEGYVVIL